MVEVLTPRHRIAYSCYLLMGVIGLVAILDEVGVIQADSDALILGAMLGGMFLAVVVPTALILSVILRKERLLLLLAGLTIGVSLVIWVAATTSPQDQSIVGWYIVPYVFFLVFASANRLLRHTCQ